MTIVRTAEELVPYHDGVLVPTMGGLHAGHAALIALAAKERDKCAGGSVVVSVFVNPKQFEESSDFDRYPRELEADADAACGAGADVVFAPDVSTVYPPGEPPVPAALAAVAEGPGLEDRFRPGHLAGVWEVLWQLFGLVRPAAAVFGEKDWQQLRLAAALAETFGAATGAGPVIIGGTTVREADGLAMSSRNRFLPAGDRVRARALSAALAAGGDAPDPRTAEAVMRAVLDAEGLRTEYAVVRDAASLLVPRAGAPKRALIAARLGDVRLIDNAAWPSGRG